MAGLTLRKYKYGHQGASDTIKPGHKAIYIISQILGSKTPK
jgi:hypothetical protein